MNLVKYMWRNVTRNKLRSTLTALSIGFSLALITVLYGYLAMQEIWGKEAERHHRIVVMNVQGFSGRLPIAYVDRVAEMDGIKAAVPYSWYGGTYKDERMPFAQFATDPQHAFEVWDDFTIAPEQLKAWQNNRRGCVIDRRTAERRGWKIGEKIPLKGTFYQFNLDLELVGTFDSPQPTDSLWFDWKYLDEGLKTGHADASGNAGIIFAKAESSSVIPQVSKAIDDQFGSSENPTRTQTEAAFAQMFADMLGDIQLYILIIGLAVTFSLTLVAATAMAMSLRERTTEIAVLKAIGFPRNSVLGLILGESCFIAGLGGLIGLAGGGAFLQMLHQGSPQFFPLTITEMAGMWMLYIFMLAVGVGFVSGIVPAIFAAQLSVIDGLRKVA